MTIKVRSISKRHLQNNFILYFILVMFLCIGIISGAICINRFNEEQNLKLINNFSLFFKYMGKEYNSLDMFKASLLSNLKTTLIIWCLGLISLGIGIIPLIIFWEGISIGFTVGFLVKVFGIKGFIFSLIGLLPYYLVIIPGFIAIGAIGLSNSNHMRKSRSIRGYYNSLADYTFLILLFFIIFIFGSLIEGFYTPYFFNFIGFYL